MYSGSGVQILRRGQQENQNKKKSDFLTFLKEIREKYKPDPDNNFYPEILEIKHENEIGVLKVDLKGHLGYIRIVSIGILVLFGGKGTFHKNSNGNCYAYDFFTVL